MEKALQYDSQISGLWWRFVTKLIAAWAGTYYFSVLIYSFVATIISYLDFMLVAFLPLIILVTWLTTRNKPSKWNNSVVFDFPNQTLIIHSKKKNSKEADILDLDGKKYSFNEIDYYSTIHYESFILSAYYLVDFCIDGKKINLLSFKSAGEFTEFNAMLKNKLHLKIK